MAIQDFSNTPLSEILSLKGRRAVVTGGAHGIGAGIVKRLAEAGVSVIIGDIDRSGAAKTAMEAARPSGTIVEALPLDVADEASILEFTDAAVKKMDGLDIWVNNVGYYPHHWSLEMDSATWDKVVDINLKGTFIASREAANRMLACNSKHGVIVNISSMAGLRARQKMAHYVSAKSGVVGLTKAMGLELGAKNIRVMGIAPANMSTRPHTHEQEERYKGEFPLGRAGKPDDIARVVLFCASDLAGFMTGSTLIVDGGTGAGIYP